ncbi:class I SAM-dependent methyltransferase [Fulvivirga sp. 29W222]|uniref:Class I SAM-dependent methyltransferase n=1 Tax=Fulvivirga marina TaxID=2494733 RepID=A0A937FXA3_9BACT|nr:class I SAM-dependent methyltransferase [Fulvivirga marina]MBL6446085.1 class I SAM-dependent methyltransferase [Fulvivirga marina]
MFEKLTNCPLCNSGRFNNYLRCKDYTVSGKDFNLVACAECKFIYTNPRPRPQDLHLYYESKDYISHSNESNSPINFIYKLARNFTLKRKVKLVNSLSQKGTILDIGCGTGHFITACQQDGWSIKGVEPDSKARTIAAQKTGIDIVDDISNINETQYDLISMWHVLEHIPNLNEFFQQLLCKVKKDGKLIIAVPNYKSHDAQHYKKYWAAYDVPRHLYHFDQTAMTQLADKYQLKVNKILPMSLDAYYVSLLSESYKGTGILKYIKAPYRGFISNMKAKSNNLNYSSLIYILTKK